MRQITFKVPDDEFEEIEEYEVERGHSNRSDALRELLRRGLDYQDLETERDRLERKLTATNQGNEQVDELVRYFEDERELRERQRQREEQRQQANILRRGWWKLAGRPSVEEDES